MKTITSALASILLISLFILSSCKPSQDVASGKLLQKRKYTKGYHFQLPAQQHSLLAKLDSPESKSRKTATARQTNSSIPILEKGSFRNSDFSASTAVSPPSFEASAPPPSMDKAFVSPPILNRKIDKNIRKIERKLQQLHAEDPYVASNEEINIFAILGFVFSLLGGLLLALFAFPFFFALLGIIFSIVGLAQINNGKGSGKAFAIIGLILGILVMLSFWALVALIALILL